ncbi:MAG TPA: ABC transporter permease [Candidatus Limnocylindria bacterium]|nr:ABC transporter permease [Candidatus Limnocylindria bacterium]
MEIVGEVAAWLTDPASWSGSNGIGVRIWEQVVLSAAALAAASAIALPAGLAIGHTGRGATAVIWIANIGRAVPSLGWIGIFFPIVLALETGESGFWTSLVALTLLAVPPIVTNTYAGLREVDRDLVEAGRGMGMREGQLLRRVELPLALPIILAGLRISATQTVATATLAAVVSGGTLGVIIIQGINGGRDDRLVGAALVVAALTLATEAAFALLERLATRRGPRRPPRGVTSSADAPRVPD